MTEGNFIFSNIYGSFWAGGNYPCIIVIFYSSYMCDFEVMSSFKAFDKHVFTYWNHDSSFILSLINFW